MSYLEQSGDLTTKRLELLAEIVGQEWLITHLGEYKEFRQKYSLESRWWHRSPDLSPLIPLVYFSKPGPRDTIDEPFGVWQGDPSGILARLMAAIVEFRDTWEKIPNKLGWNNIQYFLRAPKRFYGFKHEVSLATHLKGVGYEVKPFFFNPISSKGMADIVVEGKKEVFDIQCKARNPSNSTDFPYDLYLYFTGRWARLVCDTGTSYFLFLNVKQKIDKLEVDRLLETIGDCLKNNTQYLKGSNNKYWDFKLSEIGYGKNQMTPEGIKNNRPWNSQDPLYSDLELLRPAASSTPPLVSGCHILGHRKLSLEDYVFRTAESAAKTHDGKNPLIISVNLYQEVDMSAYMNGPNIAKKYYSWCKDFFSANRNVAMLLISSNYDRYMEIDNTHIALGKKYLAVESQHWDNVLELFK